MLKDGLRFQYCKSQLQILGETASKMAYAKTVQSACAHVLCKSLIRRSAFLIACCKMPKINHCSFFSNSLCDNTTILSEGCSKASDIEHPRLSRSGRVVSIYGLETENIAAPNCQKYLPVPREEVSHTFPDCAHVTVLNVQNRGPVSFR